MKPRCTFHYAVIAAILAGYIAIRFWHLTTSCLWFDEIFSIHAAEHSWNSILSFVSRDLIHPPLFYLLLKIWIGIGGESLFWLRLFPVLFSILAIFPFLALCRELRLGHWPKVVAFFFFAINGSLIKYAQEVRMYSLLLCLSLFSMWLFARHFQKGKCFLPLLVVNILMVYSHYFGWFVIFVEVFAIVIFQRIKIKRILLMFGVVFLSFVPWIAATWQAASAGSELGQNIGWMHRPGPIAIGQLVLNLIEPFYYPASSIDPISIYRVSLPILFIAIVAIALYFTRWKQQIENERHVVKLIGFFLVLPLVVVFATSWLLPYSIWGTRHLIIVFAPGSILLGIALSRISSSALRTSATTLILVFSGYAFVLASLRETPQYSWCYWEPLAYRAAETGSCKIYVFEDLVAYHFWYGLRQHGFKAVEVSRIRSIASVTEDTAFFLPRGFDGVKTVDLADVNETRLWIGYRGEQIDETKQPLKTFLERGYRIADREVYAAKSENAILILLEK